MSLPKAVFDKKAPTKNLITTITGLLLTLVSVVVTVLLVSGKITSDQAKPLSDAFSGIVTVGGQLVGYISAIILIFKAKDV
jgi:hypothetical protein